ncbi:MAG TPA: outer membrane protein assembly factor BamD [Methylomirabilota bacterium]|nr:outer membrane protein assembly factor BamD [Methylomirabilota bacterium]
MTAARSTGGLLVALVLVAGCANVAEVTGTASQQDVEMLRADVIAMQTAVRQLKSQLDGLAPQVEGRVRERTGETERQAGLAQRIEGLSTTVTSLSRRVDDLGAKLDAIGRQARPPASPGPTPTAPSPGATASPRLAPRATSPAPIPGRAAPTPGARSSTGALQPQDVYQAAYIDFSKGGYALAISGFHEFLRRYPDHELSANAQYWIGEAHLAMARGHIDAGKSEEATKELQQSVQAFRQVLANYSRSDKAPAALYKEALALIELKQPAAAQARLQYLVENFPQAEETPLARERLAGLKER